MGMRIYRVDSGLYFTRRCLLVCAFVLCSVLFSHGQKTGPEIGVGSSELETIPQMYRKSLIERLKVYLVAADLRNKTELCDLIRTGDKVSPNKKECMENLIIERRGEITSRFEILEIAEGRPAGTRPVSGERSWFVMACRQFTSDDSNPDGFESVIYSLRLTNRQWYFGSAGPVSNKYSYCPNK